jgi:hemoglobin
MRHMPFPVSLDMRDRWLRHMTDALESLDLPEAQAEAMREYFLRAADMLVNTAEHAPEEP